MKKIFASAIIIATMIAMAPASFAGIKNEIKTTVNNKAANENGIQLQLVSEGSEFILLQVKLRKADNRNALLRITDGKGEVLYNERFTGKEFTRILKVSPEELNSIEVVMDAAEGTSRKRYNLNITKVQAFQIEEVVSK